MPGPDADHLERQPIAVDLNDDKMMRFSSGVDTGLQQMLDANALRAAPAAICAQIGLAGVGVDRCAAAARDQTVHPIGRPAARIPFDPMIEEVIVPVISSRTWCLRNKGM